MISKIVNHNYDHPLTIHFLITNRCNLNCPKCYYNQDKSLSEVPYETIVSLFEEWSRAGVKSVAMGGGEPMLHPHIIQISRLAKKLGFYVAITTNGTILKEVEADRIHISYDAIHPTTKHQVEWAIGWYADFGIPKIGLNHVLTSIQSFKKCLSLLPQIDTITLLLEKPVSRFHSFDKVMEIIKDNPDKFWLGACLAQKLGLRRCMQGITSMAFKL